MTINRYLTFTLTLFGLFCSFFDGMMMMMMMEEKGERFFTLVTLTWDLWVVICEEGGLTLGM